MKNFIKQIAVTILLSLAAMFAAVPALMVRCRAGIAAGFARRGMRAAMGRRVGIAVLAAIIGFGLVACSYQVRNDGIDAANRGDYATAFRLYSDASARGDAYASNNLGTMYHNGGTGVVPQDFVKAAFLFRLAIQQHQYSGDAEGLNLFRNNLGLAEAAIREENRRKQAAQRAQAEREATEKAERQAREQAQREAAAAARKAAEAARLAREKAQREAAEAARLAAEKAERAAAEAAEKLAQEQAARKAAEAQLSREIGGRLVSAERDTAAAAAPVRAVRDAAAGVDASAGQAADSAAPGENVSEVLAEAAAAGDCPSDLPALHSAVCAEDVAAVTRLLVQGADVDERDADGGTALHWAMRKDSAEIARLLLAQGADARATDNAGNTPADVQPGQ